MTTTKARYKDDESSTSTKLELRTKEAVTRRCFCVFASKKTGTSAAKDQNGPTASGCALSFFLSPEPMVYVGLGVSPAHHSTPNLAMRWRAKSRHRVRVRITTKEQTGHTKTAAPRATGEGTEQIRGSGTKIRHVGSSGRQQINTSNLNSGTAQRSGSTTVKFREGSITRHH